MNPQPSLRAIYSSLQNNYAPSEEYYQKLFPPQCKKDDQLPNSSPTNTYSVAQMISFTQKADLERIVLRLDPNLCHRKSKYTLDMILKHKFHSNNKLRDLTKKNNKQECTRIITQDVSVGQLILLLNMISRANFELITPRIIHLLQQNTFTTEFAVGEYLKNCVAGPMFMELYMQLLNAILREIEWEHQLHLVGCLEQQLKRMLNFELNSSDSRNLLTTMQIISQLHLNDTVSYVFLCDCLLDLVYKILNQQNNTIFMRALTMAINLLGRRLTQYSAQERVGDILDIIEQEAQGIKLKWTFPFQSLYGFLNYCLKNLKLSLYSKLTVWTALEYRYKNWKPIITEHQIKVTTREHCVHEDSSLKRVFLHNGKMGGSAHKHEREDTDAGHQFDWSQVATSFNMEPGQQYTLLVSFLEHTNQDDFWSYLLPRLLEESESNIKRQGVLARLLMKPEIIKSFKVQYDKFFTPEQLMNYLEDVDYMGIQIFASLIFHLLVAGCQQLPDLLPYVPDELHPLLAKFFDCVRAQIFSQYQLNESELEILEVFMSQL